MIQFPLEKILTVSAAEYIATQEDRTPEDYYMLGVNFRLNNPRGNVNDLFSSHVPSSAEVVVDYRVNSGYASGTALIPKQKEK